MIFNLVFYDGSPLLAHADEVQSLLALAAGIGLVLPGLRILVPLLVPLVVVEVIAHLPHCLGSRGLVLYRHLGQSCTDIEFDVVALQNVLVVLVYFDVFVPGDALVTFTGQQLLVSLLGLVELLVQPVGSLLRVVDWDFAVLFWLLDWSGRWWWRFGSYFHVV